MLCVLITCSVTEKIQKNCKSELCGLLVHATIYAVLKERNATNGVEFEYQWSWNSTWQSYTCGQSSEQLYKNTPKNLVEYFCSTSFVAILSLCTVCMYAHSLHSKYIFILYEI